MIKPADPRKLVIDLLPRSICLVKVAAVIADRKGRILSWGWNSVGATGLGEHAEAAAIRRANRKRLEGATIYVAGEWRDRGKVVTAKPCWNCQRYVDCYGLDVVYRDRDGKWVMA